MKNVLLLLTVIISQLAFSQEEVKNYTWDAVPKFRDVPEAFSKYPAVVLKDYRLYENKIGYYQYKAFVVKHCAIRILSAEGINEYNKVSIDKKYVRDYRDLKARVIKPDGRIEELPKERILEKENTDQRQFVFEGVEKGDIIEYYYVIKDYPDFSGVEYFQREIPLLDGKFQINEIKGATISIAAYNGMTPEIRNGKHICTVTDLPAYKPEINATNIANAAKVYYYTEIQPNYSYLDFYSSLNSFADGVNAKSMVKKFVRDLNLDDITVPLDERLRKMDTYLKENVALDNQYNYKKIFEDKKIVPRMVLYLYKDVLDFLKVPYVFIATTDKFEDKFDKTMVVPATLSEVLIYIPETKKYLTPFYYWMPYGPPTSVSINNDAVSFEKNQKGRIEFDFVKIGGVSMDDNVNKTESEITLDDDMETVTVLKKSSFTGYRAFYYRDVIKKIKDDKIADFVKDVVYDGLDVTPEKYTFDNTEYRFNYDNNSPFTFDTKARVKESWVENAGKNYLITLGKVIGRQNNLYQETERESPIELNYPKKYIHTIRFTIPKGYTIGNLNTIQFGKEIKNEANEVIGKFSSSARIEGDVLSIAVEEFYNFTHLEKERYNEFRDLTNTSYDFYKSSLLLTKI